MTKQAKIYEIKKDIWLIFLILTVLMIGLYFYPQLPDRMPTHWGIDGVANGWSSKNFAIFFFPGLILFLYILLNVLPLIDPRRADIENFADFYFEFKAVLTVLLSAFYLMMIFAGLGYEINVGRYVLWGMGVLFFVIGRLMPKTEQNYTIGIRLPWTLHSVAVWEKTHQLAGRLFKFLAVLCLIAGWRPGAGAFWALIGGISVLLLILVVFAYSKYRCLTK